MHERLSLPFRLAAGAAALAVCSAASAAQVNLMVTIENLAAANSIAFAPLHVGFNNGSFDAFDSGSPAGPEIISVAELGGGAQWQAAFAAADPTSTRAAIGGALLPGASSSKLFSLIDSTSNPFFTFAAMALPSNDHFIGNDSPTQYQLFGAAGNLLISSIVQTAGDIWDAGSETFASAAAAFVAGSDATLRTAEGGNVGLNFAGLAAFNGVNTAAGYVFNSGLGASSEVYRISFATVPEPESLALMLPGLLAIGWVGRRRPKPGAERADSPLATASPV
ncbi:MULTISPECIES: spondin domain-containing protein [unclassified Candidatus Accumulibacter]|jgi:hypothetical protein|uniref:spondin domain-containing protein n=1 Tax=unclassified Candidatus Accumulibacter TaxID=2619054 RepID=UPI0025BFA1BC|nr:MULTISPECIES: spondin domain-containing protein [unclassified Candidatus Accumulibacter]HRE86686.1 spondin domain-containing protein [Accumulibacter sp.]